MGACASCKEALGSLALAQLREAASPVCAFRWQVVKWFEGPITANQPATPCEHHSHVPICFGQGLEGSSIIAGEGSASSSTSHVSQVLENGVEPDASLKYSSARESWEEGHCKAGEIVAAVPVDPVSVQVVQLNGKTVIANFRADLTDSLCLLVAQAEMVLKRPCFLIYEGSRLDREKTMSEAGFTPGSMTVVTAIVRSTQELKAGGATARDLIEAGYTGPEIWDAGFTARDLIWMTDVNLKDAEFDARELKEAGYDARSLLYAGFDELDLRKAGFLLPPSSAAEAG